MTVSASTIGRWWGHSATQVAISAGLGVATLLLCGVAAVNARRTMRAPRHAEDAVASFAESADHRGDHGMARPFRGRRTRDQRDAGSLPAGKATLSSASGRALPPFLPGAVAAPVPPPEGTEQP